MLKFLDFYDGFNLLNEMSISAENFSRGTSLIEKYFRNKLESDLVKMDDVDEFENQK